MPSPVDFTSDFFSNPVSLNRKRKKYLGQRKNNSRTRKRKKKRKKNRNKNRLNKTKKRRRKKIRSKRELLSTLNKNTKNYMRSENLKPGVTKTKFSFDRFVLPSTKIKTFFARNIWNRFMSFIT